MAKLSLEEVRSIGNPQNTYNWNLKITQPPALVPIATDLNVRCTTSELPVVASENPGITIRSHEVKFNGVQKLAGTLTLNFFEDDLATIRTFIRDWRVAQRDPLTGKQAKKDDIEAVFTLETLDNDDNANWTIDLIGCMYNNSNFGGLESGSSAGMMQPTLTIDYDYPIET